MGPWSRGERIGVMVVLMAVACVVGFGALRIGRSAASSPGIALREAFPQAPAAPPPVRPPEEKPGQPANPDPTKAVSTGNASPPTPQPEEVVVHVAGAVHHPGVYHLRPGARNEDALKAAGGPTPTANTDAVNLAAHVEDGSQLYIPTHREHPEGGAVAETTPTVVTKSSAAPSKGNDVGHGKTARTKGGRQGGKSDKLTSPGEGQVNLNTATAEDLQRLPGVGPAMADRLLAFRKQNGGFHKLEDLLQVSGIGEKKFAKLQPFVKLH